MKTLNGFAAYLKENETVTEHYFNTTPSEFIAYTTEGGKPTSLEVGWIA